MNKLQAAIVGCGGRGREHARGYAAADDVEIVALVDPRREAAEELSAMHGVSQIYSNHTEMYAACKPDIVSICTWSAHHPAQVIDSAAAGVRAIHSEKPMAPTWGEAKQMHSACETAGVQLTFCHQRRFGAQYVKARQLVKEGAIGELVRVEGFCHNMFDWGTHWFDMFGFYNDEAPAEWVLGQIEPENSRSIYGVPCESSGVCYVQYSNGVHGLLVTGAHHKEVCDNRIIGKQGMIEVGVHGVAPVRIMRDGALGWDAPSLEGVVPNNNDTTLSILDAVDCLRTGRQPTLSSRNALQSTELIFATYESCRRRSRVTLPLDIDDSPLLSMLGVEAKFGPPLDA